MKTGKDDATVGARPIANGGPLSTGKAIGKPARVSRGVHTLVTLAARCKTHGREVVLGPDAHAGHHPEPTLQRDSEPGGAGSGGDLGVRTLAVDDHDIFRETLRELIAAAPGFVLVGQACSGEESVRAVGRLSPQLVLMDVTMPGMGGIAAARAILSRYPGVAVVLISVDDPSLHPKANALGNAVAYARKQDLCPNQLKDAWETLRACPPGTGQPCRM